MTSLPFSPDFSGTARFPKICEHIMVIHTSGRIVNRKSEDDTRYMGSGMVVLDLAVDVDADASGGADQDMSGRTALDSSVRRGKDQWV